MKKNFILIILIINSAFISLAMEEEYEEYYVPETLRQLTDALNNLEAKLRQPSIPAKKISLSIPSNEDILATRRSFAGREIELVQTPPLIKENVRSEIAGLIDGANRIIQAALFLEFPIKDTTFRNAAIIYIQAQNIDQKILSNNEQRVVNAIIDAMSNVLSVAPVVESKPALCKEEPKSEIPVKPTPRKTRPVSVYIPREEPEKEKEIESPIEKIQRLAKEREERRKSLAASTQPLGEPKKPSEVSGYKPSLRRVQSQIIERPILVPEVPTKKVTFVGLNNEIEQLKSLPNTTLEEKLTKKLTAKALNDGINNLVTQKPQDAAKNNAKLLSAMKTILAVDPLLIQTSLDTMRKANALKLTLYNLMTNLYDNRISFLENEFKKITPGFKLTKGIRDDIDEGLTYPIEISGEVQDAEITYKKDGDPKSGEFFDTINDLWERLLKLLRGLSKEQKETLKKQGLDIDEYIENIEQQKIRAYCVYDPKLLQGQCLPYKSFYVELGEMAEAARQYENNKSSYSRNLKTFATQNIMNKLKAFAAYANDPKICQICLDADAEKADENKTASDFATIKQLFTNLLAGEKNKKFEDIVNTIKSIEQAEKDRRKRIKRAGVGSSYG